MLRHLLFCCFILMLLSATKNEDKLLGYWQIKKMETKSGRFDNKGIKLPVILFQFEENGTFRAGMRGTKDFNTGTWKLNKDDMTLSIEGMRGSSPEAMKITKLTSTRMILEEKRSIIYLKKL